MSDKNKNGSGTRFSLVTHCFWRYPIMALVLVIIVVVLGLTVGSPFSPRETIAKVATEQPGGVIWAVSQQLDGSSASNSITMQPAMADPAKSLVIQPLQSAKFALTSNQVNALNEYTSATPDQQQQWATNYDDAIQKMLGTSGGDMDVTPVPALASIQQLKGDFGPVPVLANAILQLASNGYLENYLQGVKPYNTYQYTDAWLYDQPHMLNAAIANGLTDDQWGMIKERGFAVGPWYLIIPAIAHVELPSGSTGPGFIFWNLVIALIFVVIFPLVPGLRDIPKKLKLYKLVYAADPDDAKKKGDE